MPPAHAAEEFDLATVAIRDLNAALHAVPSGSNRRHFRVTNPRGAHSIAVGLTEPVQVDVMGPTGYYCAGMNKNATIEIHGHAGPGVAENIMSGVVRVRGNASQYAAASGRGGLVIIEGDAATRCGISMKGVDIVVGGSVGAMSAFLAQRGTLVVLGDAGENLGDSLYEARIFVRGKVASLGGDCVRKEMRPNHLAKLGRLLKAAGIDADPGSFTRYGSARRLYHFHADQADHY